MRYPTTDQRYYCPSLSYYFRTTTQRVATVALYTRVCKSSNLVSVLSTLTILLHIPKFCVSKIKFLCVNTPRISMYGYTKRVKPIQETAHPILIPPSFKQSTLLYYLVVLPEVINRTRDTIPMLTGHFPTDWLNLEPGNPQRLTNNQDKLRL